MVGITAYGAYIPIFRLNRELIAKGWGRSSIGGERSVANHDEDSATMSVEAAMDCLQGVDPRNINGLFFASTSSPYREKLISSLVATALDLREDIYCADFANSLRAGSIALRAALDAVRSGSTENHLVVAGDCRLGYPQSDSEQSFGDGAAALAVGNSSVIATFEGHYQFIGEMMDVWRNAGDTFVRTWENRWVLGEGFSKLTNQAISGLLRKENLDPKRVNWVVFPAPDARMHRRLAQTLGFDLQTQVIDPLLTNVGDCGAAHPLMLLAQALQKAKAGDLILLAAYGNGAEAFLFKVTEQINHLSKGRGIRRFLDNKIPLSSYEKYLSYRGLLETTPGEPFRLLPSATTYWRERNSILRFHGSKCRRCGTLTYPIQRVCYHCGSKDEFDEIGLSGHRGRVFTFSLDNLAGRGDDPVVVQTVVESDQDKARIYCMMTDTRPLEVKVGMPVEFTFRRIYEGAGFQNYHWKCRPVREGGN